MGIYELPKPDLGVFGITRYPKPSSQKPKRKSLPKGVRDSVWFKYFRGTVGKCYVCKAPITITNFEVGHNKSVFARGKNHIKNLRPICRSCNRSMGTMSIETYKRTYYSTGKKSMKRRRRKMKKLKTAEPRYNPFAISSNAFR